MALIICPECGHQVSDKAAVCPNCGIAIAGNTAIPSNSAASSGMATVKAKTVVRNDSRIAPGTIVIVAGLIAVLVVLVGFYFYNNVQDRNERDAYENAMACSEAAVLQNYLDMYADAPQAHRDSVMAHLALLKKVDMEWDDALVNNSRSAFESYIRKHPESVHRTEALLKIDSIDWNEAMRADNEEAYRRYVAAHADGIHIDEARDKMDKLAKTQVGEEEKHRVTSVLTSFFNALADNDEDALTMSVDVVLNSFLHRAGATKADVISYMHRIHSPEDISLIQFRPNNDWKIEKQELATGEYCYVVNFSVDEKIDRSDTTKETFCSYKVSAKVSEAGKITDLSMKKGVME